MVGADALCFCAFIGFANLICLKQHGDQDLHAMALLEVMMSQCSLLCLIKGDDTGNLAAFEDLVPWLR